MIGDEAAGVRAYMISDWWSALGHTGQPIADDPADTWADLLSEVRTLAILVEEP
jgi:hypothetical protein